MLGGRLCVDERRMEKSRSLVWAVECGFMFAEYESSFTSQPIEPRQMQHKKLKINTVPHACVATGGFCNQNILFYFMYHTKGPRSR